MTMHSITEFISHFISLRQEEMTLGQAALAMILCYFGGILASLTPCVYPMIPITVGVVGGMGTERRSWRSILFRGMAYVSGMTVIYSFLGVIAGMSGKVFGSLTNTSGGYLFLGLVMTFASLIMLDIIPFDPMVTWEVLKRKFNRSQTHSTHPSMDSKMAKEELTLLGAFLLGASSGFIAAPCTTPVLTSILAYIAKTQSVGLGFTLMVAFSLGLGTILIAITAFAGALQILPKSGKWMKTVKIASGLILLAFAEYLIYRAGSAGG